MSSQVTKALQPAEARHSRQIDCGLRMTRPAQHAMIAAPENVLVD
jgi:hypothetical protein